MRDDIKPPFLGKVPEAYDTSFVDRTFRSIEKYLSSIAGPGPIRVTALNNPNGSITVESATVFNDTVSINGALTDSSHITVSSSAPYVQLTDTDTGSDAIISGSSTTGTVTLSADDGNEVASSTIVFKVDGTSRAIITPTGINSAAIGATTPSTGAFTTLDASGVTTLAALLDISGASAGQIKFPATQNASSDANTLDDYEEGTWTPVLIGMTTSGAGTYSVQTGTYTKIGRVVHVIMNLVWSAHTGTGNMQVTGLPFTAASGLDVPMAAWFQNLTYTTTFLARVNAGATTIALNGNASGGAAAAVAMDTAASLYLAGTYFV